MAEDTIDRAIEVLAIEVLMGRYGIDVEAAEALLRQLSTSHPTAVVARRLVSASASPTTSSHPPGRCRTEEAAPGNDHIHVRIAALIRDVYARCPDVETALDELTDAASEVVPNAQYAGITVIVRHNNIQTPITTGCYPRLLDKIQNHHRQGPCLEAIHERHAVRVDDLRTEIRWPDFQQDAVSQTPVRSVLSFPMSANDRILGALSVFAEQPHAFDARAEDLGFVYATHAALAWNALRHDAQFHRALLSRDVIGQAKGMLMERYHIDAAEAFERLRQLSQDSNTPVAEISRGLVEEHSAR